MRLNLGKLAQFWIGRIFKENLSFANKVLATGTIYYLLNNNSL